VDFQKFNSLPDIIGCPGCADAPVEWIEIKSGHKTKKIEFEDGDNIPEIKELISTPKNSQSDRVLRRKF